MSRAKAVLVTCLTVAFFAAAVPLALAQSAPPPAQDGLLRSGPPTWDANRDGVFTCDEWKGFADRIFTLADRKKSHARVDSALALVGLSELAAAYPHQLSGGTAQRASLARALVNDPKLLLLDEPLGKLDSLTRMTLQAELVGVWQRSSFTAILVTHDVEEALLLSSRIIILSERPARIKAEFQFRKPYPRHRDDPALVALWRNILETLGLAT